MVPADNLMPEASTSAESAESAVDVHLRHGNLTTRLPRSLRHVAL